MTQQISTGLKKHKIELSILTPTQKIRGNIYKENELELFTVNSQDWRLQMLDTYSINFDLNVNKCQLANIQENPSAPNSYQCRLYTSMHVENTLQAVVAMDLVSINRNSFKLGFILFLLR